MQQVTPFIYKENGVTILFTECFPLEDEIEQRYSFAVENDDVLTNKLLLSVKNKYVSFSSIGYCAKALFQIIENNSFTVLISKEEMALLVKKFKDQFKEFPEFEISDIRQKNNPCFSAKIVNDNTDSKAGEGRTKDEARGQALKNLFKMAEAL